MLLAVAALVASWLPLTAVDTSKAKADLISDADFLADCGVDSNDALHDALDAFFMEDADRNGFVTADETDMAMADFRAIDANGDGIITYGEFVDGAAWDGHG